MKNKLAYICSPYRGNAYQRIRNIAYARHITRVALELGYTPIATHLYLPQILNDDIPAQRRRGLKAGKDILNTCGTIIIGARYGISEGMAAEIEAAAGKDTIIIDRGGKHENNRGRRRVYYGKDTRGNTRGSSTENR